LLRAVLSPARSALSTMQRAPTWQRTHWLVTAVQLPPVAPPPHHRRLRCGCGGAGQPHRHARHRGCHAQAHSLTASWGQAATKWAHASPGSHRRFGSGLHWRRSGTCWWVARGGTGSWAPRGGQASWRCRSRRPGPVCRPCTGGGGSGRRWRPLGTLPLVPPSAGSTGGTADRPRARSPARTPSRTQHARLRVWDRSRAFHRGRCPPWASCVDQRRWRWRVWAALQRLRQPWEEQGQGQP